LKLLKEYAATQGFKVAREYDVETPRATGRPGAVAFGEMVDWLGAHTPIGALLVKKTAED
jgi:hypothetical protein